MTLVEHPASATPLVDWPTASRLAGRLVRPGPVAGRAELADLVDGLRIAADGAVEHVVNVTGMHPPVGGLGAVFVVDRPRWAVANTRIMAAMTDGVADALPLEPGQEISTSVSLTAAAEIGAVLAALSTRVLGQFDPYSADAGPGGRLLLVAPNILHLERTLGFAPADFRLWVALHEQTHALQFAVAPWLADHLRGRTSALLGDLTGASRAFSEARLREKIVTAGRAVVRAVKGESRSLLDGFLTAAQKAELEDLSAVMALLEGHADVAMDAVGPGIVPTVRDIRRSFEARRDGAGRPGFDIILRRLLGMDAKIAQYRDGAAFVRAVEDRVGHDGLNAVWADPANLPTAREIADARAWIRRVHG